MPDQLAGTLKSVMPPYQRQVHDGFVRVVVIDNGSPAPVDSSLLPVGVQYEYIHPSDADPYPGPSINEAVRDADELVGVMIDGARLLTPGVLAGAANVLSKWPDAVVDAKGWHLGHQAQQDTLEEGGDPTSDQQLLDEVRWLDDGYRLFEISAPTFSTRDGFLSPGNESTGFFTSRSTFLKAGGYDERFRSPGGGLANIDFWWRLAEVADPLVTLLGEGTFHQAHGGASTGLPRSELRDEFRRWRTEYTELTGREDVGPPPQQPLLVGRIGPKAQRVQAAALRDQM